MELHTVFHKTFRHFFIFIYLAAAVAQWVKHASCACRGFHVSEDVFAGYNHTLRGARTKFLEYISVGKGRDMGFDSINSFEAKVRIRLHAHLHVSTLPCKRHH